MSKDEHEISLLLDRIPQGYGRYISCEKGWHNIIIDLNKDLSYLIPNYTLYQVKEKFGTLRYYIEYNGVPQNILEIVKKLISYAEYLSSTTCEYCGVRENVKLRERGWVKTLCDKCDSGKKLPLAD